MRPKSLVVEWLEQVVHGGDVERPERILVVRGHENRGRHPARSQLGQHLEAIKTGHLHVEEECIRLPGAQQFERRLTIGRLPHLGLRVGAANKGAEAFTSERLVIGDEDLSGDHWELLEARVAGRLTSGSDMSKRERSRSEGMA